ncbi:hypothetical protein BO78DRAFT_417109 [Aspergillus sclerotiicarbonarius CBS 121057]|uniref:Uncharacterized protein n=1 Tax=Aspergillus sclerotiicarbonarius (strain CBS 121057 / IBT 28362) TaxID=1448318 RepID=A0A319EEX0_ASPSB|nr:hypothetical protein BO78DRAFT_417109 [Aspergillus sclerotiicarbonarius CBS 121057]
MESDPRKHRFLRHEGPWSLPIPVNAVGGLQKSYQASILTISKGPDGVGYRETSDRVLGRPNLYFCCQCGDGPKLYQNQPQCRVCHHIACSSCKPAK